MSLMHVFSGRAHRTDPPRAEPCPSCGSPGRAIGHSHQAEVYECGRCRLCYLDAHRRPLADRDNHWYGDLDPLDPRPAAAFVRAMRDPYTRQLERLERLAPGREILDVGCGIGVFLAVAREAGWKACGAETSEHGITYGTRRYGVRYLEDLSACPPGLFDVVRISHVLEHVGEPRAFLDLLRGLLKTGGILAVIVPNREPLAERLVNRLRGFLSEKPRLAGGIYPDMHVLGFSIRSLRAVVTAAGFEPIQTHTVSMGDPTYYPLFYDGLLSCRRPKSAEQWLRGTLPRLAARLGDPFGMGDWIVGYFRKTGAEPRTRPS